MTFQFKVYKTQITCGVSIRKLYIFKLIQWINFNNITFNSIFNNIELTIKNLFGRRYFNQVHAK
jgi:hypothetical protein